MLRPEIFVQTALVVAVAVAGFAFLIRPQLARMAKQRQFSANLNPGDRVVAAGGLVGVIVACDQGPTVDLEFAESVRMRVMRTAIDEPFEA